MPPRGSPNRQRKKYETKIPDDDNPRIVGSSRYREVNEIPPGYYTLGELAIKTRIPEVKIRRLVARNKIRPTAQSARRNWRLFDEIAVTTIRDYFAGRRGALKEETKPVAQPKPYEPKANLKMLRADSLRAELGGPKVAYGVEESKLCFPMLHAGKPLVEIVLETGLHPAIVTSIHDDYCNMIEALIVPKAVLDVINQLPLDGTFPIRDAAHILEVLETAASDLACDHCKKRRRVLCTACARGFARATQRRALTSQPRSTTEADSGADERDDDNNNGVEDLQTPDAIASASSATLP